MKTAGRRAEPGLADPARRAALSLGLAALAGATWAQPPASDYPNRPIRVIIPTAPGGPVDIVGRMMAQKMGTLMGQPMLVDDRGGAAGFIGTDMVAKAPPDGYTLLSDSGGHTSNPAFNPNAPYDPIKDFAPVTLVAKNYGQVLVVHPSVPAKNLKELIALAKARPGKLSYGGAFGSILSIAAELMKISANVDIVGVDYKGAGPAMTDLLGGHIDMIFAGTQQALPFIQAGKLRAIAITGPKRWKGLPDVPTVEEAGLKSIEMVGWFGLWAPKGTPAAVVNRLHAEAVKALQDPEVKAQLDKLGLEPSGASPDEFEKFQQADEAAMRALAQKVLARK
jgi:tripartite-type tricarboxylate transporter receptor subunit TctC